MKNEIYMNIAYEISKNSHALRRKVGCVIVKNNNIISYGYNGMPKGLDNICELNNITREEVLHAESNAISKCAKNTYSCDNSVIYSTLQPCLECSKLIIQSGIKTVYYKEDYRCKKGLDLLIKCKIKVIKL